MGKLSKTMMVDIKELTPHPLTREKELTAKNPRRYF
jgi:hypothetical protein